MSDAERSQLARVFPALVKLGDGIFAREIPVISQVTATDCGPACVAMVLGMHGTDVTLDEMRRAMGVGRDGVNAQVMVETAAFYGLRGRGVRIDVDDLAHLPRAAILHWNFSHFVVFDKLEGDGIRIVDPAVGRRLVPIAEARKAMTGIALLLERTNDFKEIKSGDNPVIRHLQDAFAGSRDWHRIVFVSVFLQLLALVLPMVHGRLVDRVVPRNDVHLLTVLMCGLGAILVFEFLANITRAQLLLQLRTAFDMKMTFGFVEHLLRLPYDFFERRHVGDLQMRIAAVAQIREVLTGAVLSGMIDGTMVVSHLFFLVLMSWKITLLAVGIVLVQIGAVLLTRNSLRDLYAGSLSKQADAANALNELLAGMESLKASGYEHRASATWAARYVEVMNVGLRSGSLMTFAGSLLGTLQGLGPIALLIVGVMEVMDRKMSLGAMMSANAFAVGFLTPTMSLVSSFQTLQLTRAQLTRIDDVRETAAEQEKGKRLAPVLQGAITLERLSFRYGPKLRKAVREVSVAIRSGEWVAIVGRSGSGKTTLGRLLLGLYEPTDGRVLFDGIPLSNLDYGSVRRQMGVVIQKPHIFGTSIRSNIALGDPEIPLDRIESAAKRAHIHDDIMAMPMQYDTPVVAGGTSLSGGQRQRLALARALVEDPAIVLLDEATSALDSMTEAAVQAELKALCCTRIFIAHRLSTVIGADRILVMEDGEIVEQGTHRELLAAAGVYARLVVAQLAQEAPAPKLAPHALATAQVVPIRPQPQAPSAPSQALHVAGGAGDDRGASMRDTVPGVLHLDWDDDFAPGGAR